MGKMGQKQGVLNLLENLAINFFWICSIKKFFNIKCILAQIPSFWDMGQNALNQSDCSTFKLTISLEQNDEKWFFAYWCRFIDIKSWFKNSVVSMVKNGHGHSGIRKLKLTVSQEGINGVRRFWVYW